MSEREMTTDDTLARARELRAAVLHAVRFCKVGHPFGDGARATLTEALADGIEFDPKDDAAGTLYEACEIITDAALKAALSLSPEPAAASLGELRALSEAATGGEWYRYGRSIQTDYENCSVKLAGTDAGKRAWGAAKYAEANAAFIVAAVNHVRALLARAGAL